MKPFLLTLSATILMIVVAAAWDSKRQTVCVRYEVITKRTWSEKVDQFLDVPVVVCREKKR